MTYSDVKQQILDKTTSNFYVFTGEELEVQNAYIKRIAESKQQEIRRIDSVSEAIHFKGLSLFGQSVCYVCREDNEFQKADGIWESIEEKVGENTLIYLTSKLDKRSKFYIFWESRILNFEPLTEQVLTKHIQEHISLSKENCKELIRVCESSYGRILSEINKIQCYADAYNEDNDNEVDPNQVFVWLLDNGTIHEPPSDAIFDWVNAILDGKPKKSFRLYQECLDIGEPSLRLLLVLYQGIKRLLQVQSCETSNITDNTGLSQWEVNLVKDYVGVYRTGELVEALRTLRELEVGIKTGRVDEEFTVPYAMINILSEG